MHRLSIATLLAVLVGSTAAPAAAQIQPLGAFQTFAASVRGNGIAFDSKNRVYLTVGTYGTLRGQFVTEDGSPVGSAFAIAAGGAYTHFPSVAYSPDADGGAGAFLVVWHASDLAGDQTSVHARMISYTRGGPYSADIQIGADQSWYEAPVNAAYSKVSQTFVVVWGNQSANISGAVLSKDGAPVTGVRTIAASGDGERWPGIACHETAAECVVSYSGWTNSSAFVRSLILNPATGDINPNTVWEHHRSSGIWQTDTAFNASTGQYVVAWYQEPGNGSYAVRVAAGTGTKIGGVVTLSTRFASKDAVDMAYNGAAGTTLLVSHDLISTNNDGGIEIGGDGTPTSVSSVLVVPTTQGNFHPSVAPHATRKEWMAVTSHRFLALFGERITTGSTPGSTPPPPGPPPPPPSQDCSATLSTSAESFGAFGGGGGFTLTIGASCSWTAGSSAPWLVLGSTSQSGTGTKVISYSVGGNPTTSTRSGIIYIGNRSVVVSQAGRTWKTTDFNGDGRNDLLWHNRTTGELAVWRMDGVNLISGDYVSPAVVSDTGWKVVGTFDANRDGESDILWQHDGGAVSIWLMNDDVLASAVQLNRSVAGDPRWRIAGTGDLDNDGFDDIIWQHQDGTVAAWYMNGTDVRAGDIVAAIDDAAWRVAGVEDFDRDGWLDLLWYNTGNAQVAFWKMQNRTLLSAAVVQHRVTDMDWQIEGVADLNGDAKPDLIWRNTRTGSLAAWLMDGMQFSVQNGVRLNPSAVPDVNWRIAGPR